MTESISSDSIKSFRIKEKLIVLGSLSKAEIIRCQGRRAVVYRIFVVEHWVVWIVFWIDRGEASMSDVGGSSFDLYDAGVTGILI